MKVARVVLGTDHAGYLLKEVIKKHLGEKGIDVVDVGTFSTDPVDYPAIMRKACAALLEGGGLGIILGGSGNGEAMAANKVHGIRAAVGYSVETARLARAHNDANVLSLGARFISPELALDMVDAFLTTDFEGGRHTARVRDVEGD
jgi:ribose 5-phosphate isomerase B